MIKEGRDGKGRGVILSLLVFNDESV